MSEEEEQDAGRPLTYGEVYYLDRDKRYVLLKPDDNSGGEEEGAKEQHHSINSLRRFYALVGLMVVLALVFTVMFAWCTMLVARQTGTGPRSEDYHQDNAHKRYHKSKRGGQVGRENAVVLVLCRNRELAALLRTLEQFEGRFNHRHKYPYVFLNNEPFSDEFRSLVRGRVSGRASFGIVPQEHWAIPGHLDRAVIRESLRELRGVVHGGHASYRQMCRWFSGYFQDHPLLKAFDYYWRIEPGVSFTCEIPYDPFEFLRRNNKLYGFSIALEEVPETIPTLWTSVLAFLDAEGERHALPRDASLFGYFQQPNGSHASTYNLCHFWSNFEIAAFSVFRSPEYRAFFAHLDRSGGFFYERWGDAPVHSLALGLLLSSDQLHWFEDIGYRHHPHSQCPRDPATRQQLHCNCGGVEEDRESVAEGRCMQRFQPRAEDPYQL